MKKTIGFSLCFCILLSFFGCKSPNETTILTGRISENIDFKISDDNSEIWLDNSDIEKISVEVVDGKEILIFTTTKDGKALLFDATTKNLNKPLSIIADTYLLSSPIVMQPIDDGKFTIASNLIDHKYLFYYLTDAKDKMEEVVPPDDLITEDMAKKKVFEYAEISEGSVTELKAELKIDDKSFGWKYCINFNANNKKYVVEVNAHTGTILKSLNNY